MTINAEVLSQVHLNSFLVSFRKANNISTRYLASCAGIKRHTLQMYEKGSTHLSKGQLIRIFIVCKLWLTSEQFRIILDTINRRKMMSKNTVVEKNSRRKHRRVCTRRTPKCLLMMRR
jgi:predicted transcriptional regulator